MTRKYFHSAGNNHSCVECYSCGEPMQSVYCPTIRDTCSECGGKSKLKPREAPPVRVRERKRLTASDLRVKHEPDDEGPRAA